MTSMASGKVARRADAHEISALLDSPEVAALIAELEALRWTGRRGYGPWTLVGACLIKALYGFTTWTRTAALIADHPGLQQAIGGCPSVFACYRFTVKLREHATVLADCLDRIAASLQAELPGIARDVAIDASDLPAYANGQRHISKRGPVREALQRPRCLLGAPERGQHARCGIVLRFQDSSRGLRPYGPAARVAHRERPPTRVFVRRPAARRAPRSRLPARDVRDGHGLRQQPRLRRVRGARRQSGHPAQGRARSGHLARDGYADALQPAHSAAYSAVPRPVPGTRRGRARVRKLEAPLRPVPAPRSQA